MQQFQIPSSADSERPHIPVYHWSTETTPSQGVIHLVHGVSESPVAYEQLVTFFNGKGWDVVAHDHIGHGGMAQEANRLGYFGVERPYQVMVADTEAVIRWAQEKWCPATYVLIGHSMGSLVVRCLLAEQRVSIDRVVLTGTLPAFPGMHLLYPVSQWYFYPEAAQYNYSLHRRIFGGQDQEKAREKWSPNPDGSTPQWDVEAFPLTNDAFAGMMQLIFVATRLSTIRKVDPNLPLFILSGSKDPFLMGERGFNQLANRFRRVGHKQVEFGLLFDKGHAILNYEAPELALNMIWQWLVRHTSK